MHFISDEIEKNINKIALSNAPLLILGESGVGKDIIANQVHKLSNRRKNKPVIINISAIPSDLLEKELFGSVKGSFTGAEIDSVGKFQLAHNSTLILDEIGELPLIVQGKLLRAIESGIIEPIGSSSTITVDCRIIAITNRNLSLNVDKGLFRKDLYYRLNILAIYVKPLRERVQDIKTLVNIFIKELSPPNKEFIIEQDALNELLNYDWPGNVRELKNTIERAITLSNNHKITSEYLLLSSDNNVNISSTSLKEALNNFKKKYILKVLESNAWNVTKSAKILDIQRTYLSRLIKELYSE